MILGAGAPGQAQTGQGPLSAGKLASRRAMPHLFDMQPDPSPTPPVTAPRARLRAWLRAGGVVAALIGICVLVEAVLLGADWGLWGGRHWRAMAYGYGAFWAGILHGWRPNYPGQGLTMFFTYAFLHGGVGHLIGNMLVLWLFGRAAEDRLGARRFALLYLGAMLGGGVGFGLLATSPAPMVGASGAIFGLAGAWVIWGWQDRRTAGLRGWAGFAPALWAVLGLMAINLIMWVLLLGHLAWETHLGGALAGMALAAAMGRRVNPA
jgi:membrane associated rhomboid family serine protease